MKKDNLTSILLGYHDRLRPPNLALKGQKQNREGSLTEPKEPIKEPKIDGSNSEEKEEEPQPKKDFLSVSLNTSTKFHKLYKNSGYKKLECAEGDEVCVVEGSQNKVRTIELIPEYWAFAEADMVSSVNCESDGITLTQASIPYVNQKAECIRTPDLLKNYHTFKGAFVLVNHNQKLEEQKGVILDAVLREIEIAEGEKVFYVRGLLAVNKQDDENLYQAVKENKVKFGSMGSLYRSTQCSKCGAIGLDTGVSDTRCVHLKLGMKGQTYKRPNGTLSKIVEWWNSKDLEGNPAPIDFVEYSLLVCRDGQVNGVCTGVNPAFNGSIVRDTANEVTSIASDKPIRVEVEEIFLRKPAFQKYLKNKQIKIVK
jgi:hypothetical protein